MAKAANHSAPVSPPVRHKAAAPPVAPKLVTLRGLLAWLQPSA